MSVKPRSPGTTREYLIDLDLPKDAIIDPFTATTYAIARSTSGC